MSWKFITTLIVCLIPWSNINADQKYFKTITISGSKNCAIFGTKKWDEKSIKEELPAGKYIIKPIAGAMSPWAKDSIAMQCCGEKPWMWYLLIEVDGKKYVMGRLVKFDTKEEAFKENQNEEISIELNQKTIIKVGTEDISDGKDYCNDNRGTETIGIIKVE
jgi:hypothetical protein